MDWFLYDRDLRQEKVKARRHSHNFRIQKEFQKLNYYWSKEFLRKIIQSKVNSIDFKTNMDLSIDDVADRAPFLSIYLSISPVFDNKIYYFLQSSISFCKYRYGIGK